MIRSNSSSEEENEAKFHEAAVDSSQLFSKNEIQKQKVSCDNKEEQRPSLRPDREDRQDDDYVLNTTPGFRKHVSRKLSEIIDSQIDEVHTDVKCDCPVTRTEGIKLFSGSSNFLQTDGGDAKQKCPPGKRKKKYSSSSSDSSDEEKFAEAAVSHDFIVKESRLLHEIPADVILKADDLVKSNCVNVGYKKGTEGHAENESDATNALQKDHKLKKKKKKNREKIMI